MIAWLNFAALIACSVLFSLLYVRSVSPAALEKKLGPVAYQRCAGYRAGASLLMLIASANYVIYYWFPLPLPIPRAFPWEWTMSAALAVLIAVPSLYLMYRGIKGAGEETMRPSKEHRMYGGIYQKIRHPQALGELHLWWVLALLVHSPFLALFSFVYVPVWYWWCRAEERDLLIRYGVAYREYTERVGFWLPRRANPGAA
jgi:protein-S-isoprenylcysteine O-methyltransferase Ste14